MNEKTHNCRAHKCQEAIREDRFFCLKHWRTVPDWLRHRISAHARIGNETALLLAILQAKRKISFLERQQRSLDLEATGRAAGPSRVPAGLIDR